MRKSPLNYLITVAIGAVLWVVTAIFYGGSFSESLMLAVSTPEEFLANFRVIFGIAAGLGIINCIIWYYYGNLESTAGDLVKAKRVWWWAFICQVLFAVGLLMILVFINLSEGIMTKDWLLMFALFAVHTWFFFWFCSFFFSPTIVKNVVLFR
ncbi:MAG TPA: hypothetical protein PKN48_06145 [Bacteroidales bacterium]|nr:hypothetical protein [Bacteroidales bacterium]